MRGNVTHDFKYLTRLPSSVSSLVAYPSPSSMAASSARSHSRSHHTSLDHQRATSRNIFRPLTRDRINFQKFCLEFFKKTFLLLPCAHRNYRSLIRNWVYIYILFIYYIYIYIFRVRFSCIEKKKKVFHNFHNARKIKKVNSKRRRR